METPRTKAARHSAIIQIITEERVGSQGRLQELLAERGMRVAQATISRDLFELHATKLRDRGGDPYYAFPQASKTDKAAIQNSSLHALASWLSDLLVSSASKDSFLILRTPAGGGQLLGSIIDNAELEAIIGCVAGDDTVLVICTSGHAAEALNRKLLQLAAGASAEEVTD